MLSLKSCFIFIFFPILLSMFVFFYVYQPGFNNFTTNNSLLMTESDLKKYNGKSSNLIYLSVLGYVFDVTSGKKHYGEGSHYFGLVGRDNTRAFATGEFNVDIPKGIEDLNPKQIGEIWKWLLFFREKYEEKGKLIGRFFNNKGEPTQEYINFMEKKTENEKEIQKKKEFDEKYPKCNSQWDINKGGEVWCEDKTKVPRKFYEKPGSKNYVCICLDIKEAEESINIYNQYDNCDSNSHKCLY